jgi:branched-chain amino acid transport system permease protein
MYAVIAVGLTLVYGLLRILHVAHAGLFALGGYIGLLITNATGNLAIGMLSSAIIVGIGARPCIAFAISPFWTAHRM